jgi:uncharacterized repeat protein (TIGR01451 family)
VNVYRMIWARRPAWASLASTSALLLAAVLALLVFRLQVLAQPETEVAALQVQKSVSASVAAPGDTLVYTIRIQEPSTPHSSLWMTDTIPDEVTYVAGSLEHFGLGSVGVANNVITWTASDFGFGNFAIITFSVEIPYTSTVTEIENTAYVTGTGALIPSSARTTLSSPLDNEGTYKAVGQGLVKPGGLVTYTVVLNNASSFSDVTAQVIDPLDPLLEYVDGSAQIAPPSSGTLVFSQSITWTVDITSATAITLVYQARVSDDAPDGEIENTITIDDGSTPFTRSASVTVNQPPTSLTTYPERGALITQDSGFVDIQGVAWGSTMWDEDNGPDFPPDPILDQINNDDQDGQYYVTWAEVPLALDYTLEEDTSPYFGDPIRYYYPTPINGGYYQNIHDKTPGIYYYRLRAHNLSGDSRWSDVQSTVVKATQAFDLSAIPNVDPALSFSPSADLATSEAITVEVRVGDTAEWELATLTSAPWGGWEWSYAWSLPQQVYDEFVIQTRARDEAGGISDIDTITVTVHNKDFVQRLPTIFLRWPPIPYETTINPIDNADEDGNYTVSWSYDHTDVLADSYTLQESKGDPTFANPTSYSTSSTSYPFTDQDDGTYYYRVRAVNQYGPGDWSGVVSAKVELSYRDDFDSATSWQWVRGDDIIKKSSGFRIRYRDGKMYVLVVGSYDFGIVSPRVEAVSVPYTVQARFRVVKDESFDGRNYYIRNGTTFGLVFGANLDGSPCPADRRADSGEGCFEHYYRLMMIYDVHSPDKFRYNIKRIDSHEEDGKGRGPKLWDDGYTPSLDTDDWNRLKVLVTESDITAYINGEQLGKTTEKLDYIHEPGFGIFIASPDIGDTGIKADWYEVAR